MTWFSMIKGADDDSNTKVALAIFMSANAYISWDEDPIITTVKVLSRIQENTIYVSIIIHDAHHSDIQTTALPIASLEYPAITICGQGMATDTLDR